MTPNIQNDEIERKLERLLSEIKGIQATSEMHQAELVDRLEQLKQVIEQIEKKEGGNNAKSS